MTPLTPAQAAALCDWIEYLQRRQAEREALASDANKTAQRLETAEPDDVHLIASIIPEKTVHRQLVEEGKR